MYETGIFMTDAQVAKLRKAVLEVGANWLALREGCRVKGVLAFKVSPKTHRYQHLPLWAQVMNPRHVQCYAEEGLIGTTTAIWEMSMNGKYEHKIQEVVLLKRTMGYFLRIEA